jgi:hypothetical protein
LVAAIRASPSVTTKLRFPCGLSIPRAGLPVRGKGHAAAQPSGLGAAGPPDRTSHVSFKKKRYQDLCSFRRFDIKTTDEVSVVGGVRKTEDQRSNYGGADYMFSGNYTWTATNVLLPLNSPPATPTFVAPFEQNVT